MKLNVARSRGSVLWVALFAIVIAMAIALSMLQTSVTNAKSQDQYTASNNSFFATHGATELVMSDLWGRFNGQNTTASGYTPVFATWLSNNATFSQINSGSGDSVAEDFRLGPNSYTLAQTTGAVPTLDTPTKVTRAVMTGYNNINLGDRMITGVRLYRKDRPQAGHYIMDLLIVAETQKYLGNNATNQATAVQSTNAGMQTELFQPQWESQLFNFTSPPNFNGFDYALLTKNLTCTMCHMRVRNRSLLDNQAAALAGGSKSLFGNFGRVKVGITDYLGIRTGQMYSTIDGTLYHRGTLEYEGSHANVTPAQFVSDTVWSMAFNTNATTMAQNAATGMESATQFVNATTDASGNPIPVPAPGGNLYLNYSSTAGGQTDGNLPSSNFPVPFPEIPTSTTLTTGQVINGPNHKVDAAEVIAQEVGLTSAVDGVSPSSIKGGIAVTLAAGTQYTQTNLPGSIGATVSTGAGNVAAAAANIQQTYTGNVVLVGTQANPIQIDGKVVIDGDVVIRGYVQGTGQIYASGNIYAPGDVIYNDVGVGTLNEQFGVNSNTDPKKQTNLLGLVAGKNIVVGDYLSEVTHWDSSQTDFFNPYTYNPSTKVLTPNPGSPDPGLKQTYVSGSTTNNHIGSYPMDLNPVVTLPTGSKYASGTSISTSTQFAGSNFANFTVEQMSYFNRNELMKVLKKLPTSDPTQASSYSGSAGVTNPNYDPNYIPRFYSLYPYNAASPSTTPAQAFLYSGSAWDPVNNHWNGTDDPHVYEYMTPVDSMPAGSISDAAIQAKNVINVHPDWISPTTMMRILSDEANNHVPVIADAEYGTSSNNYQVPDRRLDGVLYTNNAIFCVERQQSQYYNPSTGKWSKVAAKTSGYMQVNGALVAPDTGILVTGNGANNFTNDSSNRQAFLVNYDSRTKNPVVVNNQDFSSYTQWGVTRVGMVRNAKSFMPTAP